MDWLGFDIQESYIIIFQNRCFHFFDIYMTALCLSKPSWVEHSYGVADVFGRLLLAIEEASAVSFEYLIKRGIPLSMAPPDL